MNPDLSGIKAVLFDYDGTLADTNELICESWRFTVKTLADKTMTDDEIRSTFGEVLSYSMERVMPGIDPELGVSVYRKYQHDIYLDRIKLFPGTEEVLASLRESGYKTALVTSRLRSSTERGLKHFGIYDSFDVILTADDTDAVKPDPAPIYITLDKLGVRPEEAVFIGDTTHDIEAGIAAGVFTILVDWSFALPVLKRDNCPPSGAVVKKMQDIPALLSNAL